MRPVIILFAKAPVPGRVKTRLLSRFSPEEAAELHHAFVADTLETLSKINGANCELHTDTISDAWPEANVTRSLQCEGNLGLRMFHALRGGLAKAPRAMIVGSDAPTLPVSHLVELLGAPADVALGPTEDGGYYAIACRRIDERMFDGVHWSGPGAREETAKACEACGLSVALGHEWFDIDTPEDVDRLARDGNLPPATAKLLGAWRK